MGLIEQLDKAYSKTQSPDKLASMVGGQGWVAATDFDAAMVKEWWNKPCFLATVRDPEPSGGWVFGWQVDTLHNALSEYFFCLKKNYVEGDLPCP